MKTTRLLFHVHCQPGTGKDELTPSTIASRGFGKKAPFLIGEGLMHECGTLCLALGVRPQELHY